MLLKNTSGEYRVWTGLQDAETGRTLGLAPGEVADVAVDEIPADPWLRPAKGGKTARGRSTQAKGGDAASGPEGGPETASGGDEPPETPDSEPAEADASGKEA